MPNLLFEPSKRSALMASIKSKDTKPELVAFAELRARGVNFQKHYNAIGKPDIARPRKKLAVFIDGDFWHGRELQRVIDRYGEESSWVAKLRRNVARDAEQVDRLTATGWQVLRVWESDIMRLRSRTSTLDAVEAFLRSRDS